MANVPSPDTTHWPSLGVANRNAYRVSGELVDMHRTRPDARPTRLRALPQDVVIDLTRAALVIVDMQNDFCAPDGWIASLGIDTAPARELIEPINRISQQLRESGVPVIWLNWGVRPDRLNLSPGTQHPFNPNGMGPGLAGTVSTGARHYHLLQKDSWGAELVAGLRPGPTDVRIDKHRISGFWDTPFDSILRNLDVTTLLFAGVNTDHCVLGTLMDANFHGYDTILVEDCTGTTSPEFCYRATLHNVRFCFGFTVTSTDVLGALG